MSKSNNTQKTRLFNLLAKGNEVSIAEASRRLSIANPSAVVSALREDGHLDQSSHHEDRPDRLCLSLRCCSQRQQPALSSNELMAGGLKSSSLFFFTSHEHYSVDTWRAMVLRNYCCYLRNNDSRGKQ